ncbi:MAG: ATP-binding protein, partial [Candidatus Omnitrophica bacterium]|nr:ATP-binding protein [Candidatus Omnitrophota bacterium]
INAIKHGNQCAVDKKVSINWDLTEEAVVITVEDQGPGFDYKNPPDPTTEENLIKGSGRGLFLIRNAMDRVDYNAQGNRVTMTKFLPKEEAKKCK